MSIEDKIKIAVVGSTGMDGPPLYLSETIGNHLAGRDVIVLAGGGWGTPTYAARRAKMNGAKTIGFSPAKTIVEHLGVFRYPDEPFSDIRYLPKTAPGDIMERHLLANISLARECDGMLLAGGRASSLNEVINAYHMGKVIGILMDTGGVADSIMHPFSRYAKKDFVHGKSPELLFSSFYLPGDSYPFLSDVEKAIFFSKRVARLADDIIIKCIERRSDLSIRPQHLHRANLFVLAKLKGLKEPEKIFAYDSVQRTRQELPLRALEGMILDPMNHPSRLRISADADIFCGSCPNLSTCNGRDDENSIQASIYDLSIGNDYITPQLRMKLFQYHKKFGELFARNELSITLEKPSRCVEKIPAGRIHRLNSYFAAKSMGISCEALLRPKIYPDLKPMVQGLESGYLAFTFTTKTDYDKMISDLYGIKNGREYSLEGLNDHFIRFHKEASRLLNQVPALRI